MRTFSCQACAARTFFDNVRCEACGAALGYLPDAGELHALQPAGADHQPEWSLLAAPEAGHYRRCANGVDHGACNWMMPAKATEPGALCLACGLNELIPDLGEPGNLERWSRLEAAKRRVVHSLLALGLPVAAKSVEPVGMAFRFVAETSEEPALTGHDEGTITIDLAEADDATREERRVKLQEPYRTLVGHLRHESGHYYWERLVGGDERLLGGFRALFGDERLDYGDALTRHYEQGPPPDWRERYVSSYATMHPWEDWAETWAHYLHMADTTDTAGHAGLPAAEGRLDAAEADARTFDAQLRDWMALTVTLNELARSMGAPDLYPFVLTESVQDKLRFVHEVVSLARQDRPELRRVDLAALPVELRDRVLAATAHATHRFVYRGGVSAGENPTYEVYAKAGDRFVTMVLSLGDNHSVAERTQTLLDADVARIVVDGGRGVIEATDPARSLTVPGEVAEAFAGRSSSAVAPA